MAIDITALAAAAARAAALEEARRSVIEALQSKGPHVEIGAQVTVVRARGLRTRALAGAARMSEDLARTTLDISQQLVPVDSGDLKSTGRVEKRRDGSAAVVYGGKAESGNEVDYAGIVEADQPYLKPAARLAVKKARRRARE